MQMNEQWVNEYRVQANQPPSHSTFAMCSPGAETSGTSYTASI